MGKKSKIEDIETNRTYDGFRTHFNSEFVKCDYCGTENIIGKYLEGNKLACTKCAASIKFDYS